MDYETYIDTVTVQIDCNDSVIQKMILNDLLNYISTFGFYADSKDVYQNKPTDIVKIEYSLYANKTTLLTINTGSSRTIVNGYAVIRYYISVKFAGLKSYNDDADQQSNNILAFICAYLNSNQIVFKFTELDVAIDTNVSFEHMLAICTKKSPKTNYWRVGEPQTYENQTTYIENIEESKRNKAILRSYLYDKRLKEGLSYNITRFEIKLQSAFFNKYGFDITPIQNALHRYHVMYFEDIEIKSSKIDAYNNYKNPQRREIKRLGFEEYRLYPNMAYIASFIDYLLHIYYDRDFGVIYHSPIRSY
ncbi:MAG: hypothetical protein JZU62_10845 [Sulfuricurvum sp.]|uniref:hypothetical protein n=1 Tax=Sulfuricurvum sp. TaxID=2025608 RepID=UPI0025DC252F|nr:hypothetical protein [Sulfuricurvum sp.]MBV5322180.1 hypothetical protein [Sulfuricurvum sp.]